MIDVIEANWLIFAGIVALGLLAVWWLFSRATSAAPRTHRPDVLDDGVGPAQRNQALIDAAPAAHVIVPPPVSGILGGIGEVVAAAAQAEVKEARTAHPQSAASPDHDLPPQIDPSPQLPDESPQETPPAPQHGPVAQKGPGPELPDAGPAEPPPPQQTPAPRVEPVPAPGPLPRPEAAADDLSRIKGLGPKLQALLPSLGIATFAQIAAWTDEDLARIDPLLGPFAGRPARDSWVEQAMYLAADDVAGFEAKFGKV